MILKFLLWTNIGLLFLHEMDAVHAKEWRMMPGTSRFNDNSARMVFIALHLPFFVIIFYMLEFHFMILFWAVNIFLIFHQMLHLLYLRHRENLLNNRFSTMLIASMCIISIITIAVHMLF